MNRKDRCVAEKSTRGGPPPRNDPNRAFSLIEIVIAIAIAGLAFAVLSQTFVNTLQALDGIRQQNHQQPDFRFVRSQVIMERDRDEFERGGELETLNMGRVRWHAEVEETDVIDLFRVQLFMRFDPPLGEPVEEEEELWLLRPTWSDPVERSSILEDARRLLEDERGPNW